KRAIHELYRELHLIVAGQEVAQSSRYLYPIFLYSIFLSGLVKCGIMERWRFFLTYFASKLVLRPNQYPINESQSIPQIGIYQSNVRAKL
ncbi:hypothetical protein L9F63_007904, partial [Diploptera punctata]